MIRNPNPPYDLVSFRDAVYLLIDGLMTCEGNVRYYQTYDNRDEWDVHRTDQAVEEIRLCRSWIENPGIEIIKGMSGNPAFAFYDKEDTCLFAAVGSKYRDACPEIMYRDHVTNQRMYQLCQVLETRQDNPWSYVFPSIQRILDGILMIEYCQLEKKELPQWIEEFHNQYIEHVKSQLQHE